MIFFLSGVIALLAVVMALAICRYPLDIRIFVGRMECYIVQLLP
ncbi:hypothetical protein [Pseudomonas sp. GV071]|nr:hypothetical protein [Pseudomonas sp. GV071]PTQ72921.1 hypothetical protein C8K61_102129 [Pseudomonas sp. GV071]